MECVEISSIFCRILGPFGFVMGWAPNHFILGAQLAAGENMLVCIPAHLYYSSSGWDPYCNYNISDLEKVQRKGMHFVTGIYIYSLYRKCNINA